MKVAIYARVSTDEQTTDNQLPALERWITERGHILVATYSENASAWKAGHQRELARLFSELPKTGAEICLVWALDRLTRGGPLEQLKLVDRLNQFNVRLISIQESWTQCPGEFTPVLFAITGWVSQSFSNRQSERVKASIDRRRKEGKVIGRPKGSKDGKRRKNLGYILRNHPELKSKYRPDENDRIISQLKQPF